MVTNYEETIVNYKITTEGEEKVRKTTQTINNNLANSGKQLEKLSSKMKSYNAITSASSLYEKRINSLKASSLELSSKAYMIENRLNKLRSSGANAIAKLNHEKNSLRLLELQRIKEQQITAEKARQATLDRLNTNAKNVSNVSLRGGAMSDFLPLAGKLSGSVKSSLDSLRDKAKEIENIRLFDKARADAKLFTTDLYKAGKISEKVYKKMSDDINKARLDTRKLGTTLSGAMTRLGKVGTSARAIFVNLTRAYIALQSVKMFTSWIKKMDNLNAVMIQFQSNADFTDINNQLRTASKLSGSLVNKYALMPHINKAIDLGFDFTKGKLKEVIDMVGIISRKQGTDFTKNFADFTVAVGKGTPLVLDNLGALLKMEEAYKLFYERQTNVTQSYQKWLQTLTQSQKRDIYKTEGLLKLKELTEGYPLTAMKATSAMTKMSEAWDELTINMNKTGSLSAIILVFKKITNVINYASKGILAYMTMFEKLQVMMGQKVLFTVLPEGSFDTATKEWRKAYKTTLEIYKNTNDRINEIKSKMTPELRKSNFKEYTKLNNDLNKNIGILNEVIPLYKKATRNLSEWSDKLYENDTYLSKVSRMSNQSRKELKLYTKDLKDLGATITGVKAEKLVKDFGAFNKAITISQAKNSFKTKRGLAADMSGLTGAKEGFKETVDSVNNLKFSVTDAYEVLNKLENVDMSKIKFGVGQSKDQFDAYADSIYKNLGEAGKILKKENAIGKLLVKYSTESNTSFSNMLKLFYMQMHDTRKAVIAKGKIGSLGLLIKELKPIKDATKHTKELGDAWYQLNRTVYNSTLGEIPLVQELEALRGSMSDTLEKGRKLRKEFGYKISSKEFKAFENQVLNSYLKKIKEIREKNDKLKEEIGSGLLKRRRDSYTDLYSNTSTATKKRITEQEKARLLQDSMKMNELRQAIAEKEINIEKDAAVQKLKNAIASDLALSKLKLKANLDKEKETKNSRVLAKEFETRSNLLNKQYGKEYELKKKELDKEYKLVIANQWRISNSFKEHWDGLKPYRENTNAGQLQTLKSESEAITNRLTILKDTYAKITNETTKFNDMNSTSGYINDGEFAALRFITSIFGDDTARNNAMKNIVADTKRSMVSELKGSGLSDFLDKGIFNIGAKGKATIDENKFMKIGESMNISNDKLKIMLKNSKEIVKTWEQLGLTAQEKVATKFEQAATRIKDAFVDMAKQVAQLGFNKLWENIVTNKARDNDLKTQLDADKQAIIDAKNEGLITQENYTERMNTIDSKYQNTRARNEKEAERATLMALGNIAFAKGSMMLMEAIPKVFSSPGEAAALGVAGGLLTGLGLKLGAMGANVAIPATTPSDIGNTASGEGTKTTIVIHNDLFENPLEFNRVAQEMEG